MWKWIKKWRTDEAFVKWAKSFSNKLKGEVKGQFDESWPVVRTNNPEVRGSYVLYWTMRGTEGPVHSVAQPMAIAYLAYLADGAQSVGREDLLPVINNMIMNIPRIHAEIVTEVLENGKESGTDEEE